jgi:hypothetical protein
MAWRLARDRWSGLVCVGRSLRHVIPTLLLVGLLLGHWWRVVIPVAAVGWAVLLITTGVDSGLGFALSAAFVGAVNVGAGVVVYQVLRLSLRALGPRKRVSTH